MPDRITTFLLFSFSESVKKLVVDGAKQFGENKYKNLNLLAFHVRSFSVFVFKVQGIPIPKSPPKSHNGSILSLSGIALPCREIPIAETFAVPFKVAKSSLEFIRFEAEIENYGSMETVLAKLDMKTIKLSGFTELLKIRAAEAKPVFPSR